jgi:hypothetical protein
MATPQEALAAAYESWNAGDLDGYLCLYDEGIALHGYFRGDRVIERFSQADMLGLLVQVGAVPAPA